ncbi:TonB family protein [Thiocapsa sp. KS1]|nr:energy transducer TonB [Thiocapsa sp. KS1]CRI64498.1 TonB family protein [Thiocapsa sp. KS1]
MPIRSPDPEIPRILIAAPGRDASGLTFLLALLAATLLHVGAITLVSFDAPLREAGTVSESAMEILILGDDGRDAAAPTEAAALSRRDRSGASSGEDTVDNDPPAIVSEAIDPAEPPAPIPEPRAESSEETPVAAEPAPEPSAERDEHASEPAPSSVDTPAVEPPAEPTAVVTPVSEPTQTQEPPADIPDLAASEVPPVPPPPPPPLPTPADAPGKPIDAAQILASRGEEIDRLTANLQAKTAAYASRVRRKSVSASTREFRYASYLGAWARKVERIGNLNYPQAARDQRMFGSLILHVAVRSDGSVEQIRVVRSSGYDLLDEAAVRIVELAAPYAPFPPDIAAETDVLDIVRTWQFLRGGGLGWEQ